MAKIKTAHKVIFILSLVLIMGVFFEAFRITGILEFDEVEILYTYDTIKIGVPMLLAMMYVIVYLTNNDRYNKYEYTVKRCYLVVMMAFIIIAYDFGLNMANLLGDNAAYNYEPIVSIWIFSLIIIGIAALNFYIIYKYINIKKRSIRLDVFQAIFTLMYLFVFIALVTDSTYKMGVLN